MPSDRPRLSALLRREQLGLSLILASLAVIGIVVFLVMDAQVKQRTEQVRNQGFGLVRVLGGISWHDMVESAPGQGVLRTLLYANTDSDFAYGAVVDASGRTRSAVSAPGVVMPPVVIPHEPTAWIGEREIAADNRARFIEFHAPVFADSELMGHVRVGYRIPAFALDTAVMSGIAKLGLPVFVLTAFFYLLLRREIRPLRQVSQDLDEMLKKGETQHIELHPSGELGLIIDRFTRVIDEARQKIESLQHERESLQTDTKLLAFRQGKTEAILQMLPDALMVLDESGSVSYANQRVNQLLDLGGRSINGQKPSAWCTNVELRAFLERHAHGRQHVGFISDSVVFSPLHDPEMSIRARAYPLFSSRDETKRLGDLIVLRNVTDTQLAMRSRSEFVAQMAHELKTPLNVLAMYSESLLGDPGNDDAFRIEGLNVIHDEVERLSSFINGMLALSQFELGSLEIQRQRVRLPDLLHDAFEKITQSASHRGLDFQINVPRDMTPLNVDKDLLRIALNNLLTNAVKYNRPQGRVSLSAEETDDAILIKVTDTGLGISEKDQAHVFDKFFRSDDDAIRAENGHGLGLPLARQIVSLHHGHLTFESQPDVGTTFTIELGKDVTTLAVARTL